MIHIYCILQDIVKGSYTENQSMQNKAMVRYEGGNYFNYEQSII